MIHPFSHRLRGAARCSALLVLCGAGILAALAAAPASARREQRLVFNIGVEPRSLDPAIATGVDQSYILLNVLEGLTRTDAIGHEVPAMAERWDISEDRKTYTFHLRDAVWSNGTPVTAHDFVFGWRRTLAPETAGEYAYMLYVVEGAEAFNKGEAKDPAAIGVRAVDDRTLEVRLRDPVPYFLKALAHYAFFPLNEAHVTRHPKWATTPTEYLANGPFLLTEWREKDRIIAKKNPRYYNAAKVRLETIVFTMIVNESTELLQWEAGEIDLTHAVPQPDKPRLQREGKYRVSPYIGVYYVALNNKEKPLDDPRVRRALALAIDRNRITGTVLQGGFVPAWAFVPPGIPTDQGDFRETQGDLFEENIREAKRLLTDAGYPNGQGFPRIKYLYNNMEVHRLVGQAIQDMWRRNLGVNIELEVQEWKTYLINRQYHRYQMARAGWIGDYLDPVTFLDMFVTGGTNNDFQYSNPKFDDVLGRAQSADDLTSRTALLAEAERILIAEDMAVIPVYYYVFEYLQQPYVKNVHRNPIGNLYFDEVYIEE